MAPASVAPTAPKTPVPGSQARGTPVSTTCVVAPGGPGLVAPGGTGLVTPNTSAPVPRTLSFSPAPNVFEEELEEEKEVMEAAAKEEQELFEALEEWTQNDINPDTEAEPKMYLKEKIERYKTVMIKKNKIIGFIQEKVKVLDTTTKALKHDYKLSEEIVEKQKKKLDDNGIKIKKIEADYKKDKTTTDQLKKELNSLQDTVGKLTKSNSDLKIELSKTKSYIKSLEDATAPGDDEDAEDEDDDAEEEEVEAQVHRADRVDMNKDSSVHRCQACDRVFKTSADLDRHLRDKHEDTECPNCKKSFSSRKQADNHICLEGDIVPQICSMSYCKKEFVSSAMLNKHIKNNHYGHQRDVCTKCGDMINKNIGLNKHLQSCGKGSVEKEDKREKSREVCYHWKRGKCDRGSQCNFSHVGFQDSSKSKQHSTRKTPEPCRNGADCSYFSKGRCNFGHHTTDRHYPAEQTGRSRQLNRVRGQSDRGSRQEVNRARCKFGPDCDRVVNCPYVHSMEDFPQYNKKQGFRGTNKSKNNKN